MSNLPDYDEITRLRLRLGEVELQRDAFKAALQDDVKVVIHDVIKDQMNRFFQGMLEGMNNPNG